jgi:hypothetical protein
MATSSPAIQKQAEVPSARIQLREDGILHIHILVKNSFEMHNSEELMTARTAFVEGKSYPILYTTEHEFLTPSADVKRFVTSPERTELVKADAYVFKSFPQRLAARIYTRLYKPLVPTAFFSTEEDAVTWLKNYVD